MVTFLCLVSDHSLKMKEAGSDPIKEILEPLSNPTRRSILILIGEREPIPYSEILQELGLESGSFYWHLSKMATLITQNEQKHYSLTPKGKAAFRLLIDKAEPFWEEEPTRLEKSIEALANEIYSTSIYRLWFELFLIWVLWGFLLFNIKGVLMLLTVEVYDNPPVLLIWISPLITTLIILFLSLATVVFLYSIGILKSPMLKESHLKPLFVKYGTQIMFSTTPLIIPSFIAVYMSFTRPTLFTNILLGFSGFVALFLFVFLHICASINSLNVNVRDAFLIALTLGYFLFGLSFLITTYFAF